MCNFIYNNNSYAVFLEAYIRVKSVVSTHGRQSSVTVRFHRRFFRRIKNVQLRMVRMTEFKRLNIWNIIRARKVFNRDGVGSKRL